MKRGSLFFPLQQMKDDSPLLAACLHSTYVNHQLILDGLNGLEGVEESFDISITKIYGGEEKIKVNMEELKQNSCASDADGTILILILSIVAIIIFCRWRKGRKSSD